MKTEKKFPLLGSSLYINLVGNSTVSYEIKFFPLLGGIDLFELISELNAHGVHVGT